VPSGELDRSRHTTSRSLTDISDSIGRERWMSPPGLGLGPAAGPKPTSRLRTDAATADVAEGRLERILSQPHGQQREPIR
jgi:hypothetical protein